MLSISSGIGIFFGCFKKPQNTTESFLVADRKMSTIPVAMSLFASYISSITILGGPLESFNYGLMFTWAPMGFFICMLITASLFVPFFVELGFTSAYQVFS